MSKQTQGSKKKARYQKYLERERKRREKVERQKRLGYVLETGTIEEIAEAMGIPLK